MALWILSVSAISACGSNGEATAPDDGGAPVSLTGGGKGLIAFYSDRDGNPEIYLMKADGTEPIRLTRDPNYDVAPALSPDGSRIAFLTDRDDPTGSFQNRKWEIYVMNADGSGLTRITRNGLAEDHLAWSPDGTRLSFDADYDGDGFQEIWIMNADGTSPVRLTTGRANDQWASWAPDGTRIVFSSDRAGGLDLYTMNADGTGQVRITDDPNPEVFPEWSPTGDRIAFVTVSGTPTLWTVTPSGGERTQLSSRRAEDPCWSPDGAQLAFQDWNAGTMEIYRLTVASKEVANLSRNAAGDFWPSWR
jgi:TolB protein